MDFIGFGQEAKRYMTSGTEKYKGRDNETDRICLVWCYFDDAGKPLLSDDASPRFATCEMYYDETIGTYVEWPAQATDLIGEGGILQGQKPRRKFGTYIVHYRTNTSGVLPDPNSIEYEVKKWVIGVDKFRQLGAIHDEGSLLMTDLKITCTDGKFQKMQIIPARGKAKWLENPEIARDVLAQIRELEAKPNPIYLARKMTPAEILEAYGIDSTAGFAAPASDLDMSDILGDL